MFVGRIESKQKANKFSMVTMGNIKVFYRTRVSNIRLSKSFLFENVFAVKGRKYYLPLTTLYSCFSRFIFVKQEIITTEENIIAFFHDVIKVIGSSPVFD